MLRPTNSQLAQLFGILTFIYVGVGSIAPKYVRLDRGNVGYMLALVGYFLKPPRDAIECVEEEVDSSEDSQR
jgi:hypothetical protein